MSYSAMGAVPAYVDVSHFRSPYKNAYLSGFGDVDQASGGSIVEKDGVHYFDARAKESLMAMLARSRVISLGGPEERAEVVPFTADELAIVESGSEGSVLLKSLSASKWVDERVGEGKVVLAPSWLMAALLGMADPSAAKELVAIPASDKDRVKAAASTPMAAILAEPGLLARAGMVGVAIGVGVLVTGVALVVGRKRIKKRNIAFR